MFLDCFQADGDVYVWGGNGEGQLGIGDEDQAHEPRKLQLNERAVCISCGYYHTAIVTGTQQLLSNSVCHCMAFYLRLVLFCFEFCVHVTAAAAVCCCASCSDVMLMFVFVWSESGKLLTCGEAEGGKLGQGDVTEAVHIPTQVDGIPGRVVHVACGGSQTVAITGQPSMLNI